MINLARLTAALADRYAIQHELGQGGMATVYLAQDLKHHRDVAVKVLRPELAATLGPDRFLREIEVAARLHHPHILPLYDSGEAQGFLYYVMPYEEGQSLREKLANEGELPVTDAVHLLRDVADALANAHQHGVVHRDIKPDNVMLSGRHALVTDFGVAKAVSEATGRQQLTTAGVALGTPSYMAPEQAVADPHIDHRADIYALGVLAYEMLTGQPPFTGTTAQMVLAAHVTDAPEPVTNHRATVPPALAALVMKCLEKKPADRWQSADELVPQLEAIMTPSGGITPTATQPVAAPRAPRDKTKIVVAAAAVGVVIAGAAVFGWLGGGAQPDLPLIDENAVAVLPFRVTGNASLADYREGMVDILHAKFTGEGGPRAVDPRTMMSAWHREASTDDVDLSLEESLQLAATVGARQVLLGGMVGTGDRLTLTGALHRVPDGGTIAEASVEGASDSLPQLIDRLVVQLLGMQAGEAAARLPTLSASLPAVQAYLAGQSAMRSGRFLEAVGHFDRALEIDSSFALAALGLTNSGALAGNTNTDAFSRGAPLVLELLDRYSTRDSALVTAMAGRNAPGWTSLKDRIADAEAAVELAPDDAFAWTVLGDLRYQMGSYLGDSAEIERATGILDRALSLDSTFTFPLRFRFQAAINAADTTTIRRVSRMYLDADSTGEHADFVRWRAAVALEDSTELARVREEFTPWQVSLTMMGYATVYDGLPLDDWELATQQFDEQAVTARARNQVMEQRRKISALKGQAAKAIALGDSLIDWASFGPFLQGMVMVAAMLGEAGYDSAAVEKAAARVPAAEAGNGAAMCTVELWNVYQEDTTTTRRTIGRLLEATRDSAASPLCPFLLEAMVEGMSPRPREPALERLDSLMQLDHQEGWGTIANYFIARMLEAQGDRRGALETLRRRWRRVGGPLEQQAVPAYLREEGRLAALTGDTLGAIRAYQHYLTLRTDPDPSVQPEVDRVRAGLAALVGEGR